MSDHELSIIRKLSELFGIIVEALPWRFILIGIPIIGLLVAIFAPEVFG